MQCPNCKLTFDFDDDDLLIELEGCTCDCPHCGSLLIIKHTHCLDFHQYIHSQDNRWPANGQGTGFIEIVG